MAIRGIFLLSFLVLGHLEQVQAACTMTEIPNKNIPDSDLSLESFSASTSEVCYNGCLNNPYCYFARYDGFSEVCDFTTNPGSNLFGDTSVVAKKECVVNTTTATSTTTTTTPTTTTTTPTTTTTTPTTTTTTPTTTTTTPTTTTAKPATTTTANTECSMSPTTRVGFGTPTTVDMSSSAYCSLGCKSVKRCSHSEYVEGTKTCNLYSSSNIFTNSSITSWKKNTCPTANCCFDPSFATNDGKTPVLSLTSSLDSCKIMCLKWDTCAAVLFSGSTCWMYGSTSPQNSISTFYVKNCPGGAHSSEIIDPLCLSGLSIQPVVFLIITSTAGVILLQSTYFL